VRSHYPQLPVLLISGQDLRPTHNPQLPDVQLLRKPFTRVQLAQALRSDGNLRFALYFQNLTRVSTVYSAVSPCNLMIYSMLLWLLSPPPAGAF
jgi:hypothetical protein